MYIDVRQTGKKRVLELKSVPAVLAAEPHAGQGVPGVPGALGAVLERGAGAARAVSAEGGGDRPRPASRRLRDPPASGFEAAGTALAAGGSPGARPVPLQQGEGRRLERCKERGRAPSLHPTAAPPPARAALSLGPPRLKLSAEELFTATRGIKPARPRSRHSAP